MNLPTTADIVIVGGGVMRASAAYHLAQCGVKNIVLLEKEEFFGTGATGRCAGGVRYQFSTDINVNLSIESLPMIERFREEIGQDVNYRKCGYLLIATQEKDAAIFKHNVELQHSLGVGTQLLSASCSIITKDLVAVFWRPGRMASCFTSDLCTPSPSLCLSDNTK